MAKYKVIGIDSAIKELEKLADDSSDIMKMCVYDGANVVADAVRKNIQGLPTRDAKGSHKARQRGVTPEEKEGLLNGLGVARHRDANGVVDTVVGFDGYINNPTEKYPKGHAVSMVARSVEVGTSWLVKTPFIRPAINSSSNAAVAAMSKRFDEEIKKRG